MSQVRLFFITLAALLALGFLWGYVQQSESTLSPSWEGDGADIAPQRASGRDLRKMRYEKVWQIAPDGEIPIYGGVTFKVDPWRGHVFVADYGDLRIKEFDAEGKPVRAYGEGKGQGPGQFVSLTDYTVTEDGRLWTTDTAAGRITIFGNDGRQERQIKSEFQPYRLVVLPQQAGFVSMLNAVDDRLFASFDDSGAVARRFGKMLDQQERLFIALDGQIEAVGEDAFVYAGRYAGILGSWKFDGTQRFLMRTLDARPLPKVLRNKDLLRVDPTALGSTITTSVDQGNLYALSYVLEGLRPVGVLDVYSPETGEYRHSLSIPQKCTWLRVMGGDVYTLAEDLTITRWRLAGPA